MILDKKDIDEQASAAMVTDLHTKGKKQFRTVMEGLKNHGKSSFSITFKNNQLPFSSEKKVLKLDYSLCFHTNLSPAR